MAAQRSGIVTLLTDFGTVDPFVGILKGVMLTLQPTLTCVDLSHQLPAQDVRRGALALEAAWRFFPTGTVHLAVVDPGVGSPRRALIVEAAGHFFVGPDNGMLTAALNADPQAQAFALETPAYQLSPVSRTFHGRDIFAPAAAWCAKGVEPQAFGASISEPVRLVWPVARAVAGGFEGEVLAPDVYGNLLTNLDAPLLKGAPVWRVVVDGVHIPVLGTYSDVSPGALVAMVGSTGRVEICVNGGSAQQALKAGQGTRVVLEAG